MTGWPLYFKDQLILGNPESEIGIVTLWTPKEKIAETLGKENFAVCGQLYSKEGINFILRNIFSNPKIRRLIICGEDRSGSGKALVNLLEKGVDKENNIIGSDFARIHREIPAEKIDIFRKSVAYSDLSGTYSAAKIRECVQSHKPKTAPWAKPETFPERKIEFDGTMPSEGTVYPIRGKCAGEVWLEILKKIMKFGEVRSSFHGNSCRELFNIAAVVTEEDPDNIKMYPYFQITKKDIEDYIPKIMTGVKGTADYTYGERLWNFPKVEGQNYKYNQVDEVIIDYLTRYPTDRAACASLFGIQDHTAKSAPCMTFLQATIADEALQMTAYFRSHDIFGGWLLNVFGLRALQKHIAEKLGRKLGYLTVYSNCAHIYDNNWEIVQKIIEDYGNLPRCSPDPRGYLIISVEGSDIAIKHISPEGKWMQTFTQNGLEKDASRKLRDKIVQADVISQVSHGIYLGEEIQKAEIAIKKGLKYTQDQPLEL
ncbi:MAG: hypothetical protein JW727_03400 [Candidatus Aenigmarchaeota archaeon]|nr:hypothetical protein [Candidatus Aenigmarchaeota archaeon]